MFQNKTYSKMYFSTLNIRTILHLLTKEDWILLTEKETYNFRFYIEQFPATLENIAFFERSIKVLNELTSHFPLQDKFFPRNLQET